MSLAGKGPVGKGAETGCFLLARDLLAEVLLAEVLLAKVLLAGGLKVDCFHNLQRQV